MKYIKLALILIVASVLAISCEPSTPDYTGTASLGFGGDTTRITFSDQYATQIPVVFEGTSNVWPIKVNVEVVSDYNGDGYPAELDKDYMITSLEVFIGEPETYEDSLRLVGKTTITKYVEVAFPDSIKTMKDELRFKLRIASWSYEDAIDMTSQETIVIASKPAIDRLSGNYTFTGDLYKMQVNGSDTTFVSANAKAEYPVVITAESSSELLVTGLYNSAQDIANGAENLTSFRMQLTDEERVIVLPLGFDVRNEGVFGMFVGPNFITENNELLEGSARAYYDDAYTFIAFGSEYTENLFNFVFYNSKGEWQGYYNSGTFVKNARFVRN